MIWNRKRSSKFLGKPRDHHYAFAHFVARQICEQDPLEFFGLVGSPEQEGFVAWLWQVTEQQVGRPIADIDTSQLRVVTCRIHDCPMIVFEMPEARAWVEALYVGIVLTRIPAVAEDTSDVAFRHFTLELSQGTGGASTSVLCEWAGESHRNFGEGPQATLEAFVAAVRERIAAVS